MISSFYQTMKKNKKARRKVGAGSRCSHSGGSVKSKNKGGAIFPLGESKGSAAGNISCAARGSGKEISI